MKTTISKEMLTRYVAGRCTPAEELLIEEWYASFEELSPYFENENSKAAIELKARTKGTISAIIGKSAIRRRMFSYGSVAAAILILIMSGIYGVHSTREDVKKSMVEKAPVLPDSASITPGANKAVLTLADGSKLELDNAANGILAQQNNVQVVKSKDGELKYQSSNSDRHTSIAYNMLSTPRGGQYMIMLPDGSKVWLNAASSIKYPTVFTGNERMVDITGEVYFEVKKNATMPFTVRMNNGAVVKVLGTHFNISAYDDEESIKTTLLEGSVKISKDAASAILKPGEQAALSHKFQSSHNIPVQTVDLDAVMAWKNGLFQFNNVTIETVMRQVARWYDVQVVYERDVSQDLFRGKIYRNTEISQLLKILELSGVHFKIEGKKIIVQ